MSELNPYSAGLPLSAPLAADQVVVPPKTTPTRVWPVFVLPLVVLFAIVALQIVGAVAVALWLMQRGVSVGQLQTELVASLTHPAAFMLLAALGQFAMGASALVAAWLSPVPLARRLGFVPSIWSAKETAIVLLGVLVPFAIGIGSAYALALVIEPDPSVKKLYEQMTLPWFIPFVLFIALAPGFNEEMLFRGYMQRRLLARWGPWVALSITAVIFGLFHMMPHAIAAAFPIGIWLGLMAWRSGSIWPGIACHALVNGLWNIRNFSVKLEIIPAMPPTWMLILIGLIGLVAFAWSLRIMFSRPPVNAVA